MLFHVPDYSTWFTKQQSAEAIGCSTKLIEQLAKEKKIQTAKWKKPQTGARISVYHPADVNRVRKARNPGAEPFIMQASDASENSESQSEAGALSLPRGELQVARPLGLLAKALEAIAAQMASGNKREWPVPLFLTTKEAALYTGLSAGFLDGLVKSGKLPRLEKGIQGHRYRRADLDRLGATSESFSEFREQGTGGG
jgi:hypothetical protein